MLEERVLCHGGRFFGLEGEFMPEANHPSRVKVNQRCRAWCFTSFKLDDIVRLEELEAPTLVVGKEVCPTTGRPHLQGYVCFANARSLSWWKNQFPSAHAEPRWSTEEKAIEYCLKHGDAAIDRRKSAPAVKVKEKGGDVQSDCIRRLKEGESIRSLWADHPVYVATHMRMLRNVVRMLDLWGHRSDALAIENLAGLEL